MQWLVEGNGGIKRWNPMPVQLAYVLYWRSIQFSFWNQARSGIPRPLLTFWVCPEVVKGFFSAHFTNIHRFIHLFIHSFILAFIHSVRSFVRSFIHSFMHSFIHFCSPLVKPSCADYRHDGCSRVVLQLVPVGSGRTERYGSVMVCIFTTTTRRAKRRCVAGTTQKRVYEHFFFCITK